jgi:hypothetical protein
VLARDLLILPVAILVVVIAVVAILNARASDSPADERRDKRNCTFGVWLTVVPSRLNGTSISADEWRDNVRLRYNHLPLNMPQHCDGTFVQEGRAGSY